MKTKSLTVLALAGLAAVRMAAPVQATMLEKTETSSRAPERSRPRRTSNRRRTRSKPTSAHLQFEGGAFPTDASVQKIYDELDLQRATQAYMDFFPALSLYAIVKSQIRDFGFKSSSDVGVMADFMKPSENYLTGNDVTVYAFASVDLKVDGPTVVEIPPGMYGNANDAIFKYLTDFGPTGPDKGKGGKYLFLPPGPTARTERLLRGPLAGLSDLGHDAGLRRSRHWRPGRAVVQGASQGLSAGHGPGKNKAVNTSGMGANTLPPEDASVFEMLNEIIQYEPAELFSAEQRGRLASLGIEKGEPFKPDARMTESSTRPPGRVSPCPGRSSTPPGIRRSTIGPTGTGKKCSSATRNS